MAQAALITGDQGSGLETHLHIRVSWGVIVKTPKAWLHPRSVKSAPLVWGPESSISQAAPRLFKLPAKGGVCWEGGLLAAQLPWSLCSSSTRGDVVIWLPMSLMDSGSFSPCVYGVWEQPFEHKSCLSAAHRALP